MDEVTSKAVDMSFDNPAIVIAFGVTVAVFFCIWLYFTKVKKGEDKNCFNCEIAKDRDEYKKLFNGSIGYLETSVKLGQENRAELVSVRQELIEHKQIMNDISKSLSATAMIQNEMLVRIKLQNKE